MLAPMLGDSCVIFILVVRLSEHCFRTVLAFMTGLFRSKGADFRGPSSNLRFGAKIRESSRILKQPLNSPRGADIFKEQRP